MVQETFVPTSPGRQIAVRLLMKISREFISPTQIVVEASNGGHALVNGCIGTSLRHRLNRKHFQGTVGIFEPEHKACQVIEPHTSIVEVLLREIRKVQGEA